MQLLFFKEINLHIQVLYPKNPNFPLAVIFAILKLLKLFSNALPGGKINALFF